MWFERSLNVSNGNRGAENAVQNRNENFNEVRFKILQIKLLIKL